MLRNIVSNELFTVLLVVSLIVVAIAKLVSPKRFNDFILIIGNDKYIKIYSREQRFFDNFDALLFSNLILSISVFCMITYRFTEETNKLPINSMFKLAVGIAVFFLIKVLVERLIGSLFEIDALTDLLNSNSIDKSKIRFFLGYSGWSQEQLTEELKESTWIVTENKFQNLLNIESDEFWKNQLLKFGGEYQIWANAPENPALN